MKLSDQNNVYLEICIPASLPSTGPFLGYYWLINVSLTRGGSYPKIPNVIGEYAHSTANYLRVVGCENDAAYISKGNEV